MMRKGFMIRHNRWLLKLFSSSYDLQKRIAYFSYVYTSKLCLRWRWTCTYHTHFLIHICMYKNKCFIENIKPSEEEEENPWAREGKHEKSFLDVMHLEKSEWNAHQNENIWQDENDLSWRCFLKQWLNIKNHLWIYSSGIPKIWKDIKLSERWQKLSKVIKSHQTDKMKKKLMENSEDLTFKIVGFSSRSSCLAIEVKSQKSNT